MLEAFNLSAVISSEAALKLTKGRYISLCQNRHVKSTRLAIPELRIVT